MQYMGSKRRIAAEIIPLMLPHLPPGGAWVEPFVGSASVICQIAPSIQRIGSDIDGDLIAMFKAIQRGWIPPDIVTEEDYREAKAGNATPPECGFISYGCSFAGRRWEGYARNREGTNYAAQSKRSLLKQKPLLLGIDFKTGLYETIDIPSRSLIYCDPPYADRKPYKERFDSIRFWEWCNKQTTMRHILFVSEYTAPPGWRSVWQKTVRLNLSREARKNTRTEHLYIRDN